MLVDMAQAEARRCPCCQVVIVKVGGCEHMECEACGDEFDWEGGRRRWFLLMLESRETDVGTGGGAGYGGEEGESYGEEDFARQGRCEMDRVVAARCA